MDVENLSKQFTRFFVPGLVFSILALLVPITIYSHNIMTIKSESIGAGHVIILSILFGYLLDSIKGYRWTPAYLTYNKRKYQLINALALLSNEEDTNNPDDYLAKLWCSNEETYNRIFIERAEWVMILETSFSLLLGFIFTCIAIAACYHEGRTPSGFLFFIPLVLMLMSIIAARNGVDRMSAHDKKLLEAIRVHRPKVG